jgi:hypothetical protein
MPTLLLSLQFSVLVLKDLVIFIQKHALHVFTSHSSEAPCSKLPAILQLRYLSPDSSDY